MEVLRETASNLAPHDSLYTRLIVHTVQQALH